MPMHQPIKCPYCKQRAELVGGEVIYPHREDLFARKFWQCAPCDAYVGTHKDSKHHAPLGRLANAELRNWKQRAHAVFDHLWQGKMRRDKCSKNQARKAGYKWLSEQIGIPFKNCHIGYFNENQCRQVVEICGALKK